MSFSLVISETISAVFDIWIDHNATLSREIRSDNEVLRVSLRSISDLKAFLGERSREQKHTHLLKNNLWQVRHCLEVVYLGQCFSLDLDDYQSNTAHYSQDYPVMHFLASKDTPSLSLCIREVLYEKFSPEDSLKVTDTQALFQESYPLADMMGNLNVIDLGGNITLFL